MARQAYVLLDEELQCFFLTDSRQAVPARQIPQASQATTNKKAETALLVVGLVAVDRFKLLSAM